MPDGYRQAMILTRNGRARIASFRHRVHDSQMIRTFVFTASCADPLQICRHAWIAHCSSSEAAILGLAASLATATPVTLRHAITGLDQANLYLVINAIRNAGGQN